MAARAHYSATALSDAAGGEKLPSLAVTLAYVGACGGDRDEWRERWRAVAAELNSADEALGETGAVPAPYLGLVAFQPVDAEWFFGREQLIDELLDRVDATSFLALFGASGSGKSSLLRAGLLPAVCSGRLPDGEPWTTLLLTPGRHPLQELAIHAATLRGIAPGSLYADLRGEPDSFALAVRQALAGQPDTARLLLVVDQFEEIFTLCEQEWERSGFIDAVLSAVGAAPEQVRVVLGIRADFYGRCAEYAALVAAMRDAQILIGPMTEDELRSAVVEPALRAQLSVEPALVAAVIADVSGRPGALPLLSHALRETWQRRRGRTLTLAGYRAAGGVRSAIAQSAERAFGELNTEQQAVAKQMLLRLTALGEGTDDTRRRASPEELLAGPDQAAAQLVLERLTEARLITQDRDAVEVGHEALIREWPRLRGWLTEDRDSLRLHRRLTEAAVEWQDYGRDEAFLYRGARLATWRERSRDALNDLERAFLDASDQREQRDRAASRRRARVTIAALSGVLVVISTLAVVTGLERDQARRQRDVALSRQLATSALAQLATDPELGLLLAREAVDVSPTVEARAALRQAIVDSRLRATLRGHQGQVARAAFSPDGRWVVSGGDDATVRIWDAASHGAVARLQGHEGPVRGVAFSPDGRWVVSGGDDATVRIWDAGTRTAHQVLQGHGARVNALAFGAGGRWVASAADDETARIWDLSASTDTFVMRRHDGSVLAIAVSPDGRYVASAGNDQTVRIWDPTTGDEAQVLRGSRSALSSVTFAPDSRYLVSTGQDGEVRIWYWPGEQIMLGGHDEAVGAVATSRDGRLLASGDAVGTVRIWTMPDATGAVVVARHAGPVNGLAFDPGGNVLASAGADGAVRLLDRRTGTEPRVLTGHRGDVFDVTFNPDGSRLASGGKDGTVRLWDPRTGAGTVLATGTGSVFGVAFSPDGQHVASATGDGTVEVRDPTDTEHPTILRGHDGAVLGVAFAPDGQHLASAGNDGTIRVWHLRRGGEPLILSGHQGPVFRLAFSPDSRQVASAGNDETIRVWDLHSGGEPLALRGHQNEVNAVIVRPDGRTIISASDDSTVRVWVCDVCHPATNLLDLARIRTTRSLTPIERRTFLHRS